MERTALFLSVVRFSFHLWSLFHLKYWVILPQFSVILLWKNFWTTSIISAAIIPLRFTIPKNDVFIFCSVEEKYVTNIGKLFLLDAFSDSLAYNVRNCVLYYMKEFWLKLEVHDIYKRLSRCVTSIDSINRAVFLSSIRSS